VRRFRVEAGSGAIGAFGNEGFHLDSRLTMSGCGRLVWVELRAGGRIARHPAACPQLVVVDQGEGEVPGADGAFERIRVGDGVSRTPDELHETRAEGGLGSIIAEGNLDPAALGAGESRPS